MLVTMQKPLLTTNHQKLASEKAPKTHQNMYPMPDNHFPEGLDIFSKRLPGLPAHPRAQLTLNFNQIAIEKARKTHQDHVPHARLAPDNHFPEVLDIFDFFYKKSFFFEKTSWSQVPSAASKPSDP